MNCIWILLLLCCCGNRGTGNAGGHCGCGCGGNVGCGNTCGCGGHEHEHEHEHGHDHGHDHGHGGVGGGSCQGPSAVRPDNACGPRCDGVAGVVTPPWQDDCSCDRVPPFRPEPRQSYPNLSRGETCGCEEQ